MAFIVPAAIAIAALLYWFACRPLFARWGATDVDRARDMPGDADVPGAAYAATLAVTVNARAEFIWPWLVQMGYQRGGLYSYDWLDRLFGYLDRPSADRILPQWQHLEVGSVIPIGRGGGFPVTVLEPERALVLGGTGDGFAWVWQFGLYALDERRTRLVEPAAFLMTRRMLLGLKARAESLAGLAREDRAA